MPTAACVIDASPKHVSRKVQAAGGRSCDVRKNRWRGRPVDRSAALPIWKSLGNRRLQNIPAAAAATGRKGERESACSSKHKRQSPVPSGSADDLSASPRSSEIGRAHSAKEMHWSYARSCVRSYPTCVCMCRSDQPPRHEGTRGTRLPTLTFTLAPSSRGCIGSRHCRAIARERTAHTIATRTATWDDGTISCRLFVLQFSASSALFSSEKCLPCAIDAHRPLSPRPCRLTCAEPENYPSRATGLRAIVAVKGWRDLPFKFRERGKYTLPRCVESRLRTGVDWSV